MTITSFTYVDVLERAVQIIQRGEPPFSWSNDGGCCPWCAAAEAKGELDEEHGTGISAQKAVYDFVFGPEEVDSDQPLVFARKALGKWNGVDTSTLTKTKALKILREAKTIAIFDVTPTL